jgi:hypothetical protein
MLPRTIELEPIGRPQSCCVNLSLKPANAGCVAHQERCNFLAAGPDRTQTHNPGRRDGARNGLCFRQGGGVDLQGAPNPVSTFACACKSVARTRRMLIRTRQVPEGRTGTMPPPFYGKIAHQDRKYKKCSWHEYRSALTRPTWLQRAAMLKET